MLINLFLIMRNEKILPVERVKELIEILQARFENNMHRHKSLEWPMVQARLMTNPAGLWSIDQMEVTGGEPDVFQGNDPGEYFFVDGFLK